MRNTDWLIDQCFRSYLSSLDACYNKYRAKAANRGHENITLDSFDAMVFHTPYCKLVQKSLARVCLNDYVNLDKARIWIKFNYYVDICIEVNIII